MRLKILVKRWGLPDTPIVFGIDTQSTSPIVCELLKEVNDVIPIESGEWGLEDYAVELKGKDGIIYECLHFDKIATIMKEDDEVIIRPLMTHDLKVRKMTGRHQITPAGKHLVDGVVFGRQRLRLVDRPSVDIPPRKKPRLTYQEPETEDGDPLRFLAGPTAEDSVDGEGKQLVLLSESGSADDEDDEDFQPDSDVEDDTDDGQSSNEDMDTDDTHDGQSLNGDMDTDDAHNGQNANEDLDPDNSVESPKQLAGAVVGKQRGLSADGEAALEDVEDGRTRAKLRELRTVFPEAPLAVIKCVLEGTKGDEAKAYEALARGFHALPKKAVIEGREAAESSSSPKRSKGRVSKRKSRIQDESQSEALTDSGDYDDPLLQRYDQIGLPPGSISSGKALSYMADILKSSPSHKSPQGARATSKASARSVKSASRNVLQSTSKPLLDLQKSTDQGSDDSETSSSGISDSSSNAESEEEDAESTSSPGSDSDTSADASSSSSSGDDAEDEQPDKSSSKASPPGADKPGSKPLQDLRNTNSESRPPKTTPGQGTKQTHARNARRKQKIILTRYQKNGILPAGVSVGEFNGMDRADLTSKQAALTALEAVRGSRRPEVTGAALAHAKEFEDRRQKLLTSLADGGVDISPPGILSQKDTATNDTSKVSQKATAAGDPPLLNVNSSKKTPKSMEDKIAEHTSDVKSGSGSSSRPTQKSLDLGASRRMLFGAMGVKAPKTKQDENELRANLMKNVKPLKVVGSAPGHSVFPDDASGDADPEIWRQSINYSAVECCHEGVVLSEPPFPFIQRWDPQQQVSKPSKNNRGGKRKKGQRDQPQFYQDDQRSSKKQKRHKGKHANAGEQAYFDESYQPDDEDVTCQESIHTDTVMGESSLQQGAERNDSSEVDRQLLNEVIDSSATATQDQTDLVALPIDMSSLPGLVSGQARTGMTIAFKQLDMCEATQWQPEISAYKTAIVVNVSGEGELSLTLAKRDKQLSEKKYDENGTRIYGRFEVPDEDDDSKEGGDTNGPDGDDGVDLIVVFSDLIDPKIVAPTPAESTKDSTASLSHTLNPGDQISEQKQNSHVMETPLNPMPPQPAAEAGLNAVEHTIEHHANSVTASAAHHQNVTGDVNYNTILEQESQMDGTSEAKVSEEGNQNEAAWEHASKPSSALEQAHAVAIEVALENTLNEPSSHKSKENMMSQQQATDRQNASDATIQNSSKYHPNEGAQQSNSLLQRVVGFFEERVHVPDELHHGHDDSIAQAKESIYNVTVTTQMSDNAVSNKDHVHETDQDEVLTDVMVLDTKEAGDSAAAKLALAEGSVKSRDAKPKSTAEGESIVEQMHDAQEITTVARSPVPDSAQAGSVPLTPAQEAIESFYDSVLARTPPEVQMANGSQSHQSPSSETSPHRGTRTPQAAETPGDEAVFEKLMREMASTDESKSPHSPRFHGFGDSRSREVSHENPRNSATATPMKRPTPVPSFAAAATPTRKSAFVPSPASASLLTPCKQFQNSLKAPSMSPSRRQLHLSPGAASSSGWETDNSDDENNEEPFIPAAETMNDSWVTVDSDEPFSAAVTPRRSVQNKMRGSPTQPPQSGQDAPRQEEINKHTANTHSEASSAQSQNSPIVEEPQSHYSVEYPKLSVGSSFTSHVTDLGRQPDFNFDDSANTNDLSGFDMIDDNNRTKDNQFDTEPEFSPDTHEAKELADHAGSSSDEELPAASEASNPDITPKGPQKLSKYSLGADRISPRLSDRRSTSQPQESQKSRLNSRASFQRPTARRSSPLFLNESRTPTGSQIISLLSSDAESDGEQEHQRGYISFV